MHAVGDRVRLHGEDARKVTVVLRQRRGAPLEVLDSAGHAFQATLLVDGPAVSAELIDVLPAAATSRFAITLAQAVPKGAKMDFVVEKATELGVARIVPLLTERSVDTPSAGKVERWRRIATSAAQQCGRTTVPSVDAPHAFSSFVAEPTLDRLIVPWELSEPVPLRDRLPALLDGVASVGIVIGPEGGFSHTEVDAARERGAAIVSLGARILRTETAGLAVLAVLLYAAGEL